MVWQGLPPLNCLIRVITWIRLHASRDGPCRLNCLAKPKYPLGYKLFHQASGLYIHRGKTTDNNSTFQNNYNLPKKDMYMYLFHCAISMTLQSHFMHTCITTCNCWYLSITKRDSKTCDLGFNQWLSPSNAKFVGKDGALTASIDQYFFSNTTYKWYFSSLLLRQCMVLGINGTPWQQYRVYTVFFPLCLYFCPAHLRTWSVHANTLPAKSNEFLILV